MKPYRAVFLDWDDTIGDWSTVSEQAHRLMYDRHGWKELASFDEWLRVYRAHNEELWMDYSHGRTTREALHIDQFLWPILYFEKREGVKTQWSNPDVCRQLGDEYIELTTSYACLKPFATEVVNYLSSKYPLTIVSNGYVETQYRKLKDSGLQSCIAHTAFSEEVGFAKPDARIIQAAIAKNKPEVPDLQPAEVLMIGDSLVSDVQGALNAGTDCIWVRWDKQKNIPEPLRNISNTVYMVSDLREIPRIV